MTTKITPIEGKFPKNAIITQSSATLNDMGDMFISMQVKLENSKPEDFAYDWEVEFKGERYIHAIREPQASKGNDSICSIFDLTFQHWTIYQLRRYYFVEMTSIASGTAIADKYIASLGLNLKNFCVAFQRVLDYYYKGQDAITIDLNSNWLYDEEASYIEINYTHIWDVLQKMYEVFGVRWHIEGKTIKVGYQTKEVAHTFEYGFEGGLLKVERQVQSADIRNSLLGRGGEKNLPYRYFKDVDEQNPSFQADPDWIPELVGIYFTELRGKTFRDYVKGWKARHYGGEPMVNPTEEYIKGYNDEKFNPIEYVEDKDSIAKYGLLQGGLENQEDIYPTIQGVEVDGIGRVDEVVGVEKVLVDEATNKESGLEVVSVDTEWVKISTTKNTKSVTYKVKSDNFSILKGYKGTLKTLTPLATCSYGYKIYRHLSNGTTSGPYNAKNDGKRLDSRVVSAKVYNANTNEEILDISNLDANISYYYEVEIEAYNGFPEDEDKRITNPTTGIKTGERIVINDKHSTNFKAYWELEQSSIPSIVVGNYTEGIDRIYGEIKNLDKDKEANIDINSETFVVPKGGATMVDAPINIIAKDANGDDISGTYEWEKNVKLVNVATKEVISTINIPEGTYYMRVNVRIKNNHTSKANYKIELLTSYIFLPMDVAEWSPKFDIWVKNIWGSQRQEGESDTAYVERVWSPILGDKEGQEAKIVFSSGWLSGHSDWEFPILDVAYAGNEGVVNAEWRLTLAKSDAEVESTGKYIPSTQTQAKEGDHFFLIGIDMPHQYVLWAEERVDAFKRDNLLDTAHIKPTWVVQTDKVRLNQLQPQESEPLLNALNIGNTIRLADSRFIKGAYELLYLQSVTYSWGSDTLMLPNIEVVLSDKVTTSINPVSQIQGQVDALAKQVGSISNVQQIVRAIGDKTYLRKDGTSESSNSPTKFAKTVSSLGFQQGAVGGKGWGLRIENGKSIIEADQIVARETFQVNSLVTNQVASMGGTFIVSAANMECSKVEYLEYAFRCYFDQRQGSIANQFAIGDIAYSQVYSPDNVEVKYYKREVIEVGNNYIDLSTTNYDGGGAPQAGDVIVQFGNFYDTSRQGVIVIASLPKPTITQFENVDSFDLPDPVTKISPNENFFSGRMHLEAGSTGAEGLSDLPDVVFNAIDNTDFGKDNLLQNSGFTGDYLSVQLKDDSSLEEGSELFSPSLEHWTAANVITQESEVSASGVEVAFNNGGILSQSILNNVFEGDNYVVSFKAKGTSMRVVAMGTDNTIELSDDYVRHEIKIIATNSDKGIVFSSDDATMCDVQLERGSVGSEWSPSMYDNKSELEYYNSLEYLRHAIENGSSTFAGGLILSNLILLGDYANKIMKKMTAGISGAYASDNSPAFWAGGSLDEANRTINRFSQANYVPTEEDWNTMAKFVATHGGDLFLRGYIYALGGLFQGAVSIANGKIKLNDDGSGHLANGGYTWDKYGVASKVYPDTIRWVDFKDVVDSDNKILLDRGGYIDNVYSFKSTDPLNATWDTFILPNRANEGLSICLRPPVSIDEILGDEDGDIVGIILQCATPFKLLYEGRHHIAQQLAISAAATPNPHKYHTFTFVSMNGESYWLIEPANNISETDNGIYILF